MARCFTEMAALGQGVPAPHIPLPLGIFIMPSGLCLGWILFFAAASAAAEPAQPLSPDQVLGTMRSVNGYFMREHPDPGQPIPRPAGNAGQAQRPANPYPSNIWTRAVYYEGLMGLYGIDRDPRYYDYAVRWGEAHHWMLRRSRGTAAVRSADDQCIGQTFLDLYAADPKPERIADLKANVEGMLADQRADDWWWCDALQMAMPVFARLGVLTGDRGYLEKLYALYQDAKTHQGGRGLYNPDEHLWWRDRTFFPPYREPNGRNCYWARGNGWVFAALARVLDVLPADAPHRAEYLRTFREMAPAILAVQRPDGFWNVSLLDPGDFGGKEVTGTSLFAYGFALGVRRGWLPSDGYAAAAAKAWNAMAADAVHTSGFLGYVQGTGKQPSSSQPVTHDSVPDFDDFGIGCFLLAGSEVWKLAGGSSQAVR